MAVLFVVLAALPGALTSQEKPSVGLSEAVTRLQAALERETAARIELQRYLTTSTIEIREPRIAGFTISGTVRSGSVLGSPIATTEVWNLSQVLRVQVKRGSAWLEGAGIGAGFVVLVVGGIYGACQQDPSCMEANSIDRFMGVMVGGAAVLGVVGAIVGTQFPHWRTIYER